MIRKIFRLGIVAMILLSANAGVAAVLSLSDIDPNLAPLAKTELDPFFKQKVEYQVVGMDKYYKFFKSSAITYAGLLVGETAATATSAKLKGYARTMAAKSAVDDSVKEIMGDTPADKMSTEQSIALLKLKKKKGELSEDETKYFISSAVNIGLIAVALNTSIQNAASLIDTGKELQGSVKNDFIGMNALKLPGVTTGIANSMTQLARVPSQGVGVAKELTIMIEAMKMLSEK